jgi:acyl-CoA dehydrogenase
MRSSRPRSSRSRRSDDNIRFFDHRREWARTDFDRGGVPRADWEHLLAEMRRRADAAGWLRWALPAEYGGHDASNLEMAIIREFLASKGLGLHNDLQNESSIVGNFPTVLMMRDFGTPEQQAEWMPGFLDGSKRLAFGLTEPNHGSDATYLETTAVRDGDEWVLNGVKRWNSGCTTPPTTSSSPAPRASRAARSGSPPFSCRRTLRVSTWSSSGGRSTCPPTMPR